MAERAAPRVIRASELGEYAYCRRAWWLRAVQGYASSHVAELAAGTALHERHGWTVQLAAGLRWAALLLLVVAGLWWWLAR